MMSENMSLLLIRERGKGGEQGGGGNNCVLVCLIMMRRSWQKEAHQRKQKNRNEFFLFSSFRCTYWYRKCYWAFSLCRIYIYNSCSSFFLCSFGLSRPKSVRKIYEKMRGKLENVMLYLLLNPRRQQWCIEWL